MSGNDSGAAGADGSVRLLLVDPMESAASDVCLSRLPVDRPGETALLLVSLAGSLDAILKQWTDRAGCTPAQCGIVVVERARSAATAADSAAGRVRVERVGDVRDLTGLAVATTELLDWFEADRLVACVDSLTPLLLSVDERRVFRFLHLFTRRLAAAGADAHFLVDPDAHDDRTIATVRALFDEVRDTRS